MGNIHSGILIVFDVLEITVLFFLFYPHYWLCVSLPWLDIHFSWRAAPNLCATDLVWITLGQKWDSNAEAQWKAGPLWSGGQCAQICPKRPTFPNGHNSALVCPSTQSFYIVTEDSESN